MHLKIVFEDLSSKNISDILVVNSICIFVLCKSNKKKKKVHIFYFNDKILSKLLDFGCFFSIKMDTYISTMRLLGLYLQGIDLKFEFSFLYVLCCFLVVKFQ